MKPQHYRFKNYINNIVNIRNLNFFCQRIHAHLIVAYTSKTIVRKKQDLIKFDLRRQKELHVYHHTSTSTCKWKKV